MLPHYLCVEFVSVFDLKLRNDRLLKLTEVINRELMAAADILLKIVYPIWLNPVYRKNRFLFDGVIIRHGSSISSNC